MRAIKWRDIGSRWSVYINTYASFTLLFANKRKGRRKNSRENISPLRRNDAHIATPIVGYG